MRIRSVRAREILDSRSQPTLAVRLVTDDGCYDAGVPSGASTGTREAVERRDGDPSRYGGRGVTEAVQAVNGPIASLLVRERHWLDLASVDRTVCELDGTPDKGEFGANAIVGVSIAAARAFAAHRGVPLYESLAVGELRLPVPHFNVINGGAHANNDLAFQEFMIAPLGAPSFPEALRAGAETYAALRRLLAERGFATGLGDEGGFAPDLPDAQAACKLLVEAIEAAGYDTGPRGVMLALDPAANGFHGPEGYVVGDDVLSSEGLVELYDELSRTFPIWSIEDGCAEDDTAGWRMLTDRLKGRVQLVGDDVLVTKAELIKGAADQGIATAALIKVNQVGTVTETLEALATCREVGYDAMVSHRSGETQDSFIADLAVASGCGQLKAGAPARGERVAKYNRLLEIAAEAPALPYGLSASVR